MKVKVTVIHDYPTIEGMIYKNTIMVCEQEEFDKHIHDEKVRGTDDMGKIIWVPKKILKKV
jgi:hypothetical protein